MCECDDPNCPVCTISRSMDREGHELMARELYKRAKEYSAIGDFTNYSKCVQSGNEQLRIAESLGRDQYETRGKSE